jgi:uncharacterized phage protein (TIGR02220 family)
MEREKIAGGFILLARKTLGNGIMESPHLHLKLWVWILLQASWKDHGDLKRGQFFTSIDKMRDAMAYRVGNRLERPTKKQIRCAYESLRKGTRIDIAKVTHGMIITVLNYDHYQDWRNYEGHTEGHTEKSIKGTILRKKGLKKEKYIVAEATVPDIPFKEIIAHLNQSSGKKFKPSTSTTRQHIKARWNEGYRLPEFKTVIDNKVAQWQGTKFEQYLKPDTLFGTKFEGYLNENGQHNIPPQENDWMEAW